MHRPKRTRGDHDGTHSAAEHVDHSDRRLLDRQNAFEAADNSIDKQLLEDLVTMIERSEQELKKVNERIAAA